MVATVKKNNDFGFILLDLLDRHGRVISWKRQKSWVKEEQMCWTPICRERGSWREEKNYQCVRLSTSAHKHTHTDTHTHTHTHTYRRIEFPWEWKHQDIAVLFSWNTLRFTHQIWTFKTFNRKTISPFLYTVSCTRLPVPTPDDMRFLFQYGCLFRVEDACTISKITSGHIFYQLMLI